MSVGHRQAPAVQVVADRLDEVSGELLPPAFEPSGRSAGERCGEVLSAMVAELTEKPSHERVWLLLFALSGAFPVDDDVLAARRQLELDSVDGSLRWLLEWAHRTASAKGSGGHRIRLVRDSVVVDVDFTAKHDLQTGIQRVVRQLLPRWERDHPVEITVWTESGGALREAVGDERTRVLRWTKPLHRASPPPVDPIVVVPWRSTVVVPEVPHGEHNDRLAALAQHSGNRVAAIGYDCVPVASADILPEAEPAKFVRYLSLVKHVDVVAGISHSAAAEFRGFVGALPGQGLSGPRVVACPLGNSGVAPPAATAPLRSSEPEVVVVGSHDPRKNHLAILHAAEVLWREGIAFSLRFLGGAGWNTDPFDRRLRALARQGRPVSAVRGLDDDALWEAYRRASFTMFPSLHEGYGLPVVESLGFGTPVIASNFGSTAEIGADGGVLLVDPRDDDALTAAMRRLLTDHTALAELREQALRRRDRSWDDYARELWAVMVDPA